jgi:hypothetical protein
MAKKKGKKVNSKRATRLRKMIEGEKKARNWAHVEKLKKNLEWELRIIRSRRAAQKEEEERDRWIRAKRYGPIKMYEGGATGLRQQKRK